MCCPGWVKPWGGDGRASSLSQDQCSVSSRCGGSTAREAAAHNEIGAGTAHRRPLTSKRSSDANERICLYCRQLPTADLFNQRDEGVDPPLERPVIRACHSGIGLF